VLAAVKDKPSVAAEGAAILDRRSTRTALDVCGRDEGRAQRGGRTKEDDQESEEKKSGWRLHFPLPVPTACKDVGKRKPDFDTAPIRKRDFARTLN
jgi:hypothetical protein